MAAFYKPEGILLGLCLVSVGCVWTLHNLGQLDMLTVLRNYWPLSLVVWGLLDIGSWWTTRRER